MLSLTTAQAPLSTDDDRGSGRAVGYVEPKFVAVSIYPLEKFISICQINGELQRYCGQDAEQRALFLPLTYTNPFPHNREKSKKHRNAAYTRVEVRWPEKQFHLLQNSYSTLRTCQFCKHWEASQEVETVGTCTFWASKGLRFDSCSTFTQG